MQIDKTLSEELGIELWQSQAVIKLLDEGNTIPFIARYRKEATGNMTDDKLREFEERLNYLKNLEERKATIISSIDKQGKLDDNLKKAIEDARTSVELEDLYRPYKPKRRTRATIAKEKGLEALSEILISGKADKSFKDIAASYVNPEKEVKDIDEAISGAKDIVAEIIADNPTYRTWIRRESHNEGILETSSKEKKADENSVYSNYFSYEEPLRRIPGHRILAINRGEKEKALTVRVKVPEDNIIRYLNKQVKASQNPLTSEYLKDAVLDSYKRLIAPSIETELRNELTEKAEKEAIEVFGKNLKQLLMQPPFTGKTVLGWDPAFRTGCKIAVVDPMGKVLDTTVIFPTAPQNRVAESMRTIYELIKKYNVDIISLGNGTASRESEQIIADFIRKNHLDVKYVIVNEAGASVYSASETATEEFPNYDVGQRSAISMARRLQDPLAELVKIDPRSIGVGQYQHDMNQSLLSEKLNSIVEDCVNQVGVDLNTASSQLLSYVAGIHKGIAKNIVLYREENGEFSSRQELLKVPKLGKKAFLQCAGFLRIRNGKDALDGTAVHPESYNTARELLNSIGLTTKDLFPDATDNLKAKDIKGLDKLKNTLNSINELKALSDKTGTGIYTLQDIIKELLKPGRDPREDIPKPLLSQDVLEISQLKEGMILKGTVRNVVDFGAFIDIGVHQDGLVHISQLKKGSFVKHPLDVVSVGDIVDVKVLSVDTAKKRISLSMII